MHFILNVVHTGALKALRGPAVEQPVCAMSKFPKRIGSNCSAKE